MNAISNSSALALDTAVPLSVLQPGESGTIVFVEPHLAASRRLLALGFVPGSEVSVRRVAPLRDPVEYALRGACVSLRRQEASWVLVQPQVR